MYQHSDPGVALYHNQFSKYNPYFLKLHNLFNVDSEIFKFETYLHEILCNESSRDQTLSLNVTCHNILIHDMSQFAKYNIKCNIFK